MPTLGAPKAFIEVNDELFDDVGNLNEDSREFLQGWMDKYVDWVEQHAH